MFKRSAIGNYVRVDQSLRSCQFDDVREPHSTCSAAYYSSAPEVIAFGFPLPSRTFRKQGVFRALARWPPTEEVDVLRTKLQVLRHPLFERKILSGRPGCDARTMR